MRPVSPEARVVAQAASDFELGRQSALQGDFQCAQFYFDRALGTVRPLGGAAVTNPEIATFSAEMWEGIVRYEALAAPPEETASGEGDHLSPELQKIEAPVEASAEAISEAASAVASDAPGVSYDIPIVVNEGVLKILATFQHDLHDIIGRGLARSGRYMPMIHRVFKEEGIPGDLAQVALIESSFLPRAHSSATAHGIWQFMPKTGRQYGLNSSAVIDERSDPEKATRAAAKHLRYLHELFHDWYLALAAYNAGEGRVLRAMEKSGITDFWQLASTGILKPQTQNYVPAVIAATLIAKNPAHYGFDVEYEKPLEYETVLLDRAVRLRHLTSGEKFGIDELQRLNPELRSEVTPRLSDGYLLKVPVGTAETVRLAYAEAPTARPPAFKRHVARRGETLASVARRFHVAVADLASANSLSAKVRLRRGQVVVIPQHEVIAVAAARKGKKSAHRERGASRSRPAAVAASRSYKVRGGDTLYRIAARNGTTVQRLMKANSLAGSAEIRPGDRLRIPTR
ncbi:MAG: LysM peptidoglycan-binding domain-containing protein [Acidobacteriota bacterium]